MKGWVMPKTVLCITESVNSLYGRKKSKPIGKKTGSIARKCMRTDTYTGNMN